MNLSQDTLLADKPISVLEHLSELRRRIIWCIASVVICFALSYHYSSRIYLFLARPLTYLLRQQGSEPQLIFTALTEAFFTYIKVSVFSAIFISIPVILFQIWLFINPALYPREKRIFRTLVVSAPLLFLTGAALAYFIVIPLAWRFFLSFQVSGSVVGANIELQAKVSEYLSLVMHIVMAFGFAFELPVVLSALCYFGIVQSSTLKNCRRHACVGSFALAAILTPPDVITQISLAIPLMILYEISIYSTKIIENNRF
ncbi:MAG: twin-arginine translocase subunit TatC [Gluconobacter potus]|uniref:twin-arginine translocase subunit TatC n=1 Tax=Gluconobacter potus TaxID=2724927 RepID=UPI0039E79ABD